MFTNTAANFSGHVLEHAPLNYDYKGPVPLCKQFKFELEVDARIENPGCHRRRL